MIDKHRLDQVRKFNQERPLAKVAVKLLGKAGVPVQPEYPAPLLLALHALADKPEVLPDPVAGDQERQELLAVAALDGPLLANLRRLLPQGSDDLDAAELQLAKELEKLSPEDAGARLAENLYWNLANEFPESYGPVTPE